MSDGVQERGLEAFALALGLGFADLLNGACSFDGDRNKGADGVERLAREPGTRNAQAPDGLDAQANGKEVQSANVIGDDFVPKEGGLSSALRRPAPRHNRNDNISLFGEETARRRQLQNNPR